MTLSVFALPSNTMAKDSYVITCGEKHTINLLAKYVMQEAYRKAGLKVRFEHNPVKRSLLSAISGDYDGELIRTREIAKQYPNLVMVEAPILIGNFSVYTHKISEPITHFKQFKKYQIGLRKGVLITKKITNGMKQIFFNNEKHAVRLLLQNRVDVIFDFEFFRTKQSIWKSFLPAGVKRIDSGLPKVKGYHFLHNKNRDLAPRLGAILKKMRTSGAIEKIVGKALRSLS